MSALLVEPLNDVNPLPQDVPAAPMVVSITADPDGSPTVAPSSKQLSVPARFAGVIQLVIDTDALPNWVFLRGYAFNAPLPPDGVEPDPGPTTVTFSWLNIQPHNEPQNFNYTIYLLNTATGDTMTIDPTVENGPVG